MNQDAQPRFAHYEQVPEIEFTVQQGDEQVEWSEQVAAVRQISDEFGSDTLSVTLLELDPGESTPIHAHAPPVEEYYIVLEGKVDLDMPNDRIEGATPGMIAYFPPGVEHRPNNRYEEKAIQLGFRSLSGEIEAAGENVRISDQ